MVVYMYDLHHFGLSGKSGIIPNYLTHLGEVAASYKMNNILHYFGTHHSVIEINNNNNTLFIHGSRTEISRSYIISNVFSHG